ncbi:MAG TPA: hypothetical protein DDX92_06660 [Flavobacteriales bacterium]|jgi:rhodanese-related sulfurtransferase|nr:hypothetical protein [Flavobacteriales bacterium]
MSVSKAIRVLYFTSALFGLFGLLSCSHSEIVGDDFIISVHELKEIMESDTSCVIIDFRTRRELKSGIIQEAKWVDFNDPNFVSKVADYNGKEIYLYCHSWRRSEVAAKELLGKGYEDIYSVLDGIKVWKRNDYVTEKPFK